MKMKLIVAVWIAFIPSLASAKERSDIHEVFLRGHQMMQDGSMHEAMEQGRENVRAFQRLQEHERRRQNQIQNGTPASLR